MKNQLKKVNKTIPRGRTRLDFLGGCSGFAFLIVVIQQLWE